MEKKKVELNNSFFKFEKIGCRVEGNFKGFAKSKYGLVMVLDKYFVDLNKAALKQVIKDNLSLFINNAKVSITFIDEQKVKGQKNKVKIFKITINGKEIKSNFDLQPATTEDINLFFTNLKP